MQILKSKAEIKAYRVNIKGSVALVPTMGALHNGHLSLIDSARVNNQHVIVSIFVNPTQFGVNEDFDTYPRDIQKDIDLCKKALVSAVFIPDINEMYDMKYAYEIDEITLNPPKSMGYILEGFDRPTHFAGVLQIVLKLFCLIRPHRAYFGQKDAQQVLIIQKMIKNLCLDIEIIPCAIKRDKDGLALSSRNIYLSKKEREIAISIPRTIQAVDNAIKAGEINVERLESMALKHLSVEGLEICYATFRNRDLEPIAYITQNKSIFLVAVRVGKTRLIDNLWI